MAAAGCGELAICMLKRFATCCMRCSYKKKGQMRCHQIAVTCLSRFLMYAFRFSLEFTFPNCRSAMNNSCSEIESGLWVFFRPAKFNRFAGDGSRREFTTCLNPCPAVMVDGNSSCPTWCAVMAAYVEDSLSPPNGVLPPVACECVFTDHKRTTNAKEQTYGR